MSSKYTTQILFGRRTKFRRRWNIYDQPVWKMQIFQWYFHVFKFNNSLVRSQREKNLKIFPIYQKFHLHWEQEVCHLPKLHLGFYNWQRFFASECRNCQTFFWHNVQRTTVESSLFVYIHIYINFLRSTLPLFLSWTKIAACAFW